MTNNHLKRITAPKTWKVERKTDPFVTKPNAGAHSYDLCVSINTFFKQYTDVTTTTKETSYLLTHETVEVNGTAVDDHRHQVGFLDVVDIPHANTHFLVSINKSGQLKAIKHDEPLDERFDKITGKRHISGGQTQLTT
jgi:Ribosomal protein S4E